MLLGFAAFAEQPFSTVAEDSNVIISTNANALTFAIGNYSIIAGTIVEVVAADPLDITSIMPTVTTTSNALTITTTEPTVTGSAVVSVSGNPLTFTVNDTGVIVWNPIDPNPGNVWVPIKPYGGTP